MQTFLLNKKICVEQPSDGFKIAIDTVLLAAACPAKKNQTVLDAGSGVGGVTFCLLQREPDLKVIGIEVDEENHNYAIKNRDLNGVKNQVDFRLGNLFETEFDSRFDHVVTNPPYLQKGTYNVSPSGIKDTAHGFNSEGLSVKHWIKNLHKSLVYGGTLTLIYRADKLDEILSAIYKKFGAIEIIPLWPREGQEPKRIIIRAKKGKGAPLRMLTGLVLHDNENKYSHEAEDILREGKGLFL